MVFAELGNRIAERMTSNKKKSGGTKYKAVGDCQCRVSRSGFEGFSWADQLENT